MTETYALANAHELTKETLFDAFMQYHCSNLHASLPFFKDGQIHDTHEKPLQEGRSENPHYNGLLLLYDGATILERARTVILRPKNGIRETHNASTAADLAEILRADTDPDSVYLYNTVQHELTRIKSELRNCGDSKDGDNEEDIETLLELSLPRDFLSQYGVISPVSAGTKTAIAVYTAHFLNKQKYFPAPPERENQDVRALVIKKTAYGSLGMGKLAEFGENGLLKEFFFCYAPRSQGPFIDEEHSIEGIYREYKGNNYQKPNLLVEKKVTLPMLSERNDVARMGKRYLASSDSIAPIL